MSEFKSKCLSVLKDVNRQKKRVVITKRGKPIAEVVPYNPEDKEVPLKETVTFIGDILSPVAEEDWEVLR